MLPINKSFYCSVEVVLYFARCLCLGMMACKGWQINRTASQVDLTPPEVFPTTTNLQVQLQFLVQDSPHLLGEGQDEHLPSHLIGFLLQLLVKDFTQILQPPVVTQDPLDPLS